jgi:hypothetical protein
VPFGAEDVVFEGVEGVPEQAARVIKTAAPAATIASFLFLIVFLLCDCLFDAGRCDALG